MCGIALGTRLGLRHCRRLWHVASQQIVERGYIRRPLNACVTAQGHNTPTRATYVAQEKLYDCSCTDDLRALRLLGPTDRVTEGACPFASRVLDERLRDQLKL